MPQTENTPALRALYPTMIVAGVALITLGPLLDAIIADLGIERAQGGTFALAYFLGMNLSVLSLNFATGHFGSRRTLVAGALVHAAGLVLFGAAPGGLGALCAYYVIAGVGYGYLAIYPGIYVTSLVKTGTEAAMSRVFGFVGVGVTITPFVIGALLDRGFSWRAIVLGEAAIAAALAAFLATARLNDIPGRKNLSLADLATAWRFNRTLWIAVFIAVFLYVGSEGTFNIWLAKFHTDIHGAGPFRAGLAVTIFWSGLAIGRLGLSRLASQRGSTSVLVAFSAAMAAGIVLTAYGPTLLLSELFAFISGLAASLIFPVATSYASRFPDWLAGPVYSSTIFAAGLGNALVPYAAGWIADLAGFRAAMACAALPMAGVIWCSRRAECASA
ncbi:MAG: MFS transporter [Deltaproteobacteria bacterium]|nr:MFS transporter [Deltaproteobacteria bacterium]